MKYQKTVACIVPFTTLQISPLGEIFLCCPAWTKFGSVGRITKDRGIETIWNNEKSRFVREKVLENSLQTICDMKYCPYAIANKPACLQTKESRYKKLFKEISEKKTSLETFPRTLIIAHSGRCNLRCIMCCSNESFVKEDTALNDLIYKRELPALLPRLSEIILSGNGDPFFMKDSREFLQAFDSETYPNVFFSIITNAIFFTELLWKSIQHNRFGWISVSIDAATKPTYERIRKGGVWEVLQKNLSLISRLRKEKRFFSFTITFVVMKSNYTEMKSFVEMGILLGADKIVFQKIFGAAAINENINSTRNKEVMREIGTIIQDPLFRHPSVDTSLIDEYRLYANSTVTGFDKATTKFIEQTSESIKKLKKLKNRILPKLN
jgi:MoaA/NifB/PqqE/SkfB family radical SAM enzyme